MMSKFPAVIEQEIDKTSYWNSQRVDKNNAQEKGLTRRETGRTRAAWGDEAMFEVRGSCLRENARPVKIDNDWKVG